MRFFLAKVGDWERERRFKVCRLDGGEGIGLLFDGFAGEERSGEGLTCLVGTRDRLSGERLGGERDCMRGECDRDRL